VSDSSERATSSSFPTLDVGEFRAALGRFATGITVVTTTLDGEDHAMTANAFTSVSLDPPIVLMCVEKVARFHEAVLAAGVWGVSVLAEEDADVATWFATRGRPLAGQFEQVEVSRGPVTGVPLLAGALSAVECRTRSMCDGGDHTVVLGDALWVAVPAPQGRPLVYLSGGYHGIGPALDGRSPRE
jgi:flavin reductase (DIM6/NTAB) family NADH-FMN oxidoreductase RutF